jgi:peptidoglycan/LPS O-acetylase OafA/YrhL
MRGLYMKQHFKELDSMRGVAAVTVIFSHMLLIYPIWSGTLMVYSPLFLLRSGHEAVIFFFVLSGFVLSLSFANGRNPSYPNYVIKRIFRIYIPYAVVTFLTFWICYLIPVNGFENVSSWLSGKWNNPPSFNEIAEHFMLLGNFSTTEYNPIVWSLTQEMRISIIFPLLMVLVIKINWKVLLISLCFSIITGLNNVFQFEESQGYYMAFSDSLHFILMFMLGAVLAINREILVSRFKNLSSTMKIVLFLTALFAYCYSRLLPIGLVYLGFQNLSKFSTVIQDWGISFGVSIFIISVLSSVRLSKVLLMKWILHLGKISYSLYLLHLPVLFSTFYLLNEKLQTELIFAIAFPLIFILSTLSYEYVEKPAINFGRKLTGKTDSKKEKVITKEIGG